jgi:hypothetical protein
MSYFEIRFKSNVLSFTQGKDDVLNVNDVKCREMIYVNNLSIFFLCSLTNSIDEPLNL